MFNLNIPPSSLLGVEGSGGLCSKPNTPEILNSLIAMTNPLDNYNFPNNINSSNNTNNNNLTATTPASVTVRNFNANTQNTSQDSSHSSSSSTPLDSPAGTNTTPSVQQTCSQLIKAGLKLSIQSKRKLSTCDSSSGSEQPVSKCSRPNEEFEETTDDESDVKATLPKGLTPEDEDRRRRRRERNKIAATKCRMKKRERTQNLIKEAEQLDTQNVDLKNQVRVLENERRKLLEMLQAHEPACVHHEGLNLPSKLLQSPAFKYLADLNLDDNSGNSTINALSSPANITNGSNLTSNSSSQTPTQRTVIPPMSTIKFSRSNGFKAAAAVSAALTNPVSIVSQLPSLSQTSPLNHHSNQLPNGYCKPSPTPQELGYLNSPSQDSTSLCIPGLQTPTHLTTTTTPTAHQTVISNSASSLMGHSMSDYIPNCDSSGLGLTLAHTPTTCTTPLGSNGGDSSALLASVASPMSCVSTPTTATEFVKNELVDSQSPYTTAQSAERFLFESNCDSFVDIKHAVNVHQPINHNHGGPTLLQNSNIGGNILDFTSSLMGSNGSSIVPFHDQISIKNDYLHEADLLAQLTGEAAEFVDLDTGVAAAFMANGGCLA
ncbi:activating transcription factor 3 [Cochliomyia hominivorax]